MVESKNLILDSSKNVKSSGAHFLRGGAFKTSDISLQK